MAEVRRREIRARTAIDQLEIPTLAIAIQQRRLGIGGVLVEEVQVVVDVGVGDEVPRECEKQSGV